MSKVKGSLDILKDLTVGGQVNVQDNSLAISKVNNLSTSLNGKADKSTTISAGTGLSGGGDLSANRTINLANTAVTAGSYGSNSESLSVTVDQQGRLTNVSTQGIDHNALVNYDINQHRQINDSGTSTTDLLSASKILALIGGVSSGQVRKGNVDTSTEGLGNITLSGEQTLNGLTTNNSRVVVTEQTNQADNGIYVTSTGAWARSADLDQDSEIQIGVITTVDNTGSTVVGTSYFSVDIPPSAVIGVTPIVFAKQAPLNLGTTAGTACAGNDPRLPTQDENDALVGTNGTASSSNKYVTNSDPRNTNSRTCNNSFDNASTARTNLGVAIGSDVQAFNSDLSGIAGLTPSNDDVLQRKAGAWTNRTISQLKSDLNYAASEISNTPAGNIASTTVQDALNELDTEKEPVIAVKNTAFNKNFGNATNTVCEGNDARLGTKNIDETNIGDGKVQTYNATSGNLEYQGFKTLEGQSLFGSGNIDLTKSDVGLSNVDNTSDLNKPISTATQTALDAKQSTLVSGTNIKTINGSTVLGSGDLVISGGGGGTIDAPSLTALGDSNLLSGSWTSSDSSIVPTSIQYQVFSDNGITLIYDSNLMPYTQTFTYASLTGLSPTSTSTSTVYVRAKYYGMKNGTLISSDWSTLKQLKYTTFTGPANNSYGGLVAISGDGNTIATIPNGANSHVYIYTRASNVWSLSATITNNTAFTPSIVRLSADGTSCVVGMPFDTTGGTYNGRVFVFDKVAGNWPASFTTATSIISNLNYLDGRLGYDIAFSGDGRFLLMSMPGYGSFSGSVWFLRRTSTSVAFPTNDISSIYNGFITGSSVFGKSATCNYDGSLVSICNNSNVYIYTIPAYSGSNTYFLKQTIALTVTAEANRLRLSADGTTLVVSDHTDNGNRGIIRIYARNKSSMTYNLIQSVTGGTNGDQYGFSIGVASNSGSGDNARSASIVVGAINYNSNRGFAGLIKRTSDIVLSTSEYSTANSVGTQGEAVANYLGTSVDISYDGLTIVYGATGFNASQGKIYISHS